MGSNIERKEGKMSSDFIHEEVKKKPINRDKVLKKIIVTIICAVIFGVIASLIILVLEPFLQRITTKDNSTVPIVVDFGEELSPEEMLSEYMLQEYALSEESEEVVEIVEPVELPLSEEQINAILSRVTFDLSDYRAITNELSLYMRELSKYMITVNANTTSVDWMNSVNDESDTVSGIIVANNNVEVLAVVDSKSISKADELILTFNNGISVPAYIKGIDSDTNIAVVAVALSDIPAEVNIDSYIAVVGSSSTVYVGSSVIALGSPEGIPGSVGFGMVNVPRSYISGVDNYYYSYETNILSSKMASGAVFSMTGKLIGIITTDRTSTSGNSVIMFYGISELKRIIEDISNGEKRPYLGIFGTDVSEEAHWIQGVPNGAYVLSTKMDSPAMLAGIQTGDIITEMDGNNISSYAGYILNLSAKKPGDEVKITVQRKNQNVYSEIKLTLVIEEK